MKNSIVVLIFISNFYSAQNAWINEFHYDNTGSPDIGEFVEVAIENSGTYDLDDFKVSFYSSTAGTRYGVYHNLSTFSVGETENNITLYSKLIEGIQNGSNDGIALDYQNSVLHFISYEGILTASEGAAEGVTSEDVGVTEDNSTPIGYSIGLVGAGTNPSQFSWSVLSDDTPGQSNLNQALPVELTSFSAALIKNEVILKWSTITEVNNYGFEIERQSVTDIAGNLINKEWGKIGFVEGYGNSNSPKYYTFSDNNFSCSGNYLYRLKQIDIDGMFKYSNVTKIYIDGPDDFIFLQNYPNPFNPSTKIKFSLPEEAFVKLEVYNSLGELVAIPLNEKMLSGYHTVNFNGDNYSSGIYYYKFEANNIKKIMKMMLLK